MRHLRKRLTGPRADRPQWRATVLAVCDGCSAAMATTHAAPEALDPPDNYLARD